MKTVLCINGSDSMGLSGIQADIRTIKDLGEYALTAVTSVTVQNSHGITDTYELPTELIVGQLKAIYEETHPDSVKIGLVNDPDSIREIRNEVVGCREVVCSPVIISSFGGLLMNNDSVRAYCNLLLPICRLLIVKCTDAEIMLGHRISTDNDMRNAVAELHEMGAEWVLLRGGTYSEGRINALLSSNGSGRFFSSVNVEAWQRHGVGGTLSTAIATQLAKGDGVADAVTNAHSYIHCQQVYSSQKQQHVQRNTLYDRFMSLVSDNYRSSHDVTFYADSLSISTRYLSQITKTVCARSPKQIIDGYLLRESEQLLSTTSLSIQQIAIELGFSSQITFAKFFKAKKHRSPSYYRHDLAI